MDNSTNLKQIIMNRSKLKQNINRKGFPFLKTSFFMCIIALALLACKNQPNGQEVPKNSPQDSVTQSLEKKETDKKVILFYGNSLTAGYGLDPTESFPAHIQRMVDSLNLNYEVINAGLSGETTSGGLKRIDWVMKQKVDVFILELGANDMLRGLPLVETKKNLSEILEIVRKKNPDIKIGLCEMMSPPNMGDDYVQSFSQIYKDLSMPNDVKLIPFFLKGVAGNPNLLLPDGKHPNAEGQKIAADNIWSVLKEML